MNAKTFMGSFTVSADGDRLSYMGLQVLSCHCIAPPTPPLSGKLPTSVVLPIPIAPMVFAGGPPMISFKVLANKVNGCGYGAGAKGTAIENVWIRNQ